MINKQAVTEAALLLAENDAAQVKQLSHLSDAECKAAVALAMELQKRQLVEECRKELNMAKSKQSKNRGVNQQQRGASQKQKQVEIDSDNSDVDDEADDGEKMDLNNFKGIFYGDNDTKKYTDPKTGAHFEYNDLVKRMMHLKEKRKILDRKLGLPPEETSPVDSSRHNMVSSQTKLLQNNNAGLSFDAQQRMTMNQQISRPLDNSSQPNQQQLYYSSMGSTNPHYNNQKQMNNTFAHRRNISSQIANKQNNQISNTQPDSQAQKEVQKYIQDFKSKIMNSDPSQNNGSFKKKQMSQQMRNNSNHQQDELFGQQM